jgi:general stress protein 26
MPLHTQENIMEVKDFSEIGEEFDRRVRRMVWCNVATVDSQQRPRSRIMHPIWEGSTGWIGTWRKSYKHKNLERNPYVSLAYISETMSPVYVDCKAEWVDDPAVKQRIWDLFKNTPEPVGYNPAETFYQPDENFGVLKLTPWRIALISYPAPSDEVGQRIWRRKV